MKKETRLWDKYSTRDNIYVFKEDEILRILRKHLIEIGEDLPTGKHGVFLDSFCFPHPDEDPFKIRYKIEEEVTITVKPKHTEEGEK